MKNSRPREEAGDEADKASNDHDAPPPPQLMGGDGTTGPGVGHETNIESDQDRLKKVKDAFGPSWESFVAQMLNWESDPRPELSDTVLMAIHFNNKLVACGFDSLKIPAMAAALVKYFQVSVPSTSKTLTMEMLEAEFGPPNYDPAVNEEPLSGTRIERDNVVPEFRKYCDFLLQDDKTKPTFTADSDRDYYPLAAMLGRPGAGKTFALKLIGRDAVKRGSVAALISFGNGTHVRDAELERNNEAAISVRILFSLWRHVDWLEFSEFCYRHADVPSINRAIEAVSRVAGKPTSPFVLLVDETNSGGEEFCSKVLTTVGQLQQGAVLGSKTSDRPPVFVISTSLRPDYVESASTESKRQIWFIDLPPFSRHAMRKLKDDWCEKLFGEKNSFATKDECDVFVSQVLQYTGGLPRAVQWAYKRIFFGAAEIDLNRYYSHPTFDVVKMCLLGNNVSRTDSFVSNAISRFGVSVDDDGHPSLPPFQLHRWAALEKATDDKGSVAEVLKTYIPMEPPAALGNSTNVGDQRLKFERLTVAFELMQGILHDGAAVRISALFGEKGAVTNLDPDEATVCFTAKFRDKSVQDVPSSLFERKNDRVLRLLDEGKRVVGPQNPNNTAIDHANVVTFSTDSGATSVKALWLAQDKFKSFFVDKQGRSSALVSIVEAMKNVPASRADVIADFKRREREAKAKNNKKTEQKYKNLLSEIDATGSDLPERRMFVVYSRQDDKLSVSEIPDHTIVVTRRGSERMLSGLGGATLMFD